MLLKKIILDLLSRTYDSQHMLMIVANEMKQRNKRNFSMGIRLREESSYNSFIEKVRISINISGRKNILPFCYQREYKFLQ